MKNWIIRKTCQTIYRWKPLEQPFMLFPETSAFCHISAPLKEQSDSVCIRSKWGWSPPMQPPLEKPRNYLKCCQTSSLLIYTEVSKLGIKGLIVKRNGVRKNLLCRYLECKHMSLLFTDTCYVLSFAIIMLNTSLHNPNVRDKPGVDRFISMNRGINEGGDLPEELLRVRSTQHCFSL